MKRRRDSYLAQAIATDLDLYNPDADGRRRDSSPDLVEVDLGVSLLMSTVELLQQIRDFTAGHKKPKVKAIPRPKTAKDLYERQQMRLAREHIESVLSFVPQEQWERTIAEAGGE